MSVRHIILVKFVPGISEEVKQNWQKLASQLASIPVVRKIELGKIKLPTPVDSVYDNGFIMHFDSAEDLAKVYQPHPDHLAYKTSVKGIVQETFVFDFEI
ncbi:hypothetical protein PLICRDRAFT_174129 [Plicaturopsis crispa FD-325 SS-3]|nr:hypothetical protein PLICRDRAFT_174129 [Plicaturopsis crispa FD-325 SS-3]